MDRFSASYRKRRPVEFSQPERRRQFDRLRHNATGLQIVVEDLRSGRLWPNERTRMMNDGTIVSPPDAPGPGLPAAIEVAHLTKFYKTTRAVDDVSFRISRGSTTGLLGGNGAGKTTTIAMIMGLVLPSSGHIEVLGCSMPRQSGEVLGRMNFESPYVDMPMRLTVRQNLTIFGRLYGVENLTERIEKLAADLDLGEFLDRANGKLSAGQKPRVALAKALINQPELLLLDEPTASLDPDTADWIRRHLQTYRRQNGATILLASHNMLEVERLCDRVIIMKRGRIEDDDSPDKIMARYNRATLEEVFLDVARGRLQEGMQ
jgi:ABC-2 type transport system ATP-binding protein